MGSTIEKYDREIEKKKGKLLNIFSEIEEYTSESPLEQSKCLPLYLRPQYSMTSGSSRPRDLLLRGTGDLMESSRLKEDI